MSKNKSPTITEAGFAKRSTITSFDDLPDLIQRVFPIWEKAIDRLNSLSTPTNEDLQLSLKLVQQMTSSYTTYRILRQQLKQELQAAPLNNLLTQWQGSAIIKAEKE